MGSARKCRRWEARRWRARIADVLSKEQLQQVGVGRQRSCVLLKGGTFLRYNPNRVTKSHCQHPRCPRSLRALRLLLGALTYTQSHWSVRATSIR